MSDWQRAPQLVRNSEAEARVVVPSDPQECRECHDERRVFVWPYRVCEGCWRQKFAFEHERNVITRMPFWPATEELVQEFRDIGKFSLTGNLTIDLDKLEPENRKKLSVLINSPVEALEQQLCLLIERHSLATKLEVVSDKNRLFIVPTAN